MNITHLFQHLAVMAAALLFGCKAHVKATIRSPVTAKTSYEVAMLLADDPVQMASSPRIISLGNLAPGKAGTAEGTVARDGTVKLTAAIPGSAIVWSTTRTVTDDINIEEEIVPTGRTMDTLSLDQLRSKLLDLGRGYGFEGASLAAALKNMFGAACIIGKNDNGQLDPPYLCFKPTQLGNEVSLADFQPYYHRVHDIVEFETNASTAANVGLSLAIFSLKTNFNSDSIYRFVSDLVDFGPVEKPEAASFDLDTALGAARKMQLQATQKAHPGSRFVYINHMWVIRSGKTDVFEGSKLSVGANVAAGSILTVDGAYSMSSQAKNSKIYNDEVYDFWGEERSLEVGGGVGLLPELHVRKLSNTNFNFDESKGIVAEALLRE